MPNYETQPPIDPDQELVIDYNFSEAEEEKIDRYMNGGYPMNHHDAMLQVYSERPREDTSLSTEATKAVLAITENPVTHPHYSRRGGRAYAEPSDSESDPYWNDSGFEPMNEEQRQAYDEFIAEQEVAERERAITYLMEERGMPLLQAEVVYKIRKEKRERLKRERGIA